MIELPDDFRDLLVEFHDAGAEFVVLEGHAVAFHGHPRATKDLDVLVRADTARRVYRALAAFGAPLQTFEVNESDFAYLNGLKTEHSRARNVQRVLQHLSGETGAPPPAFLRPRARSKP